MNHLNSDEISVLVVDDEDVIRRSLVRELKTEHFAVTSVSNGDEALGTLQHTQYDIVITDLMMPGTDGFGVLKAVKQLNPLTSVIILTGYGDMLAAIEALRLGADDFTIKPCEVEELVLRIRRCLEKRSLLQLLTAQKLQLEEEITRRRFSEEQLRQSDKRFRLALDASSNGVWDRNVKTGETYWGENWYRTLGYEPGMENNLECSFENLLHPEDREMVLNHLADHIQGKTARYEVEYRFRNQTGGWTWILSKGQAVSRDENGQATRIIGTVTDISRLKEVEQALLQSQSALERRVEERTAELSEANIALKVVLKKLEEDRKALGDQVVSNTSKLVAPYLDRLKECRLTEQQRLLVDILRANINELTSPFANNFSTKLCRLTPVEIQVANLIKLGKGTKEIADIMHLAPGTISIHRKNIRKKLNLTHQKTNLQTTLSMNS
jgi:PAS domain S-box-containing protein